MGPPPEPGKRGYKDPVQSPKKKRASRSSQNPYPRRNPRRDSIPSSNVSDSSASSSRLVEPSPPSTSQSEASTSRSDEDTFQSKYNVDSLPEPDISGFKGPVRSSKKKRAHSSMNPYQRRDPRRDSIPSSTVSDSSASSSRLVKSSPLNTSESEGNTSQSEEDTSQSDAGQSDECAGRRDEDAGQSDGDVERPDEDADLPEEDVEQPDEDADRPEEDDSRSGEDDHRSGDDASRSGTDDSQSDDSRSGTEDSRSGRDNVSRSRPDTSRSEANTSRSEETPNLQVRRQNRQDLNHPDSPQGLTATDIARIFRELEESQTQNEQGSCQMHQRPGPSSRIDQPQPYERKTPQTSRVSDIPSTSWSDIPSTSGSVRTFKWPFKRDRTPCKDNPVLEELQKIEKAAYKAYRQSSSFMEDSSKTGFTSDSESSLHSEGSARNSEPAVESEISFVGLLDSQSLHDSSLQNEERLEEQESFAFDENPRQQESDNLITHTPGVSPSGDKDLQVDERVEFEQRVDEPVSSEDTEMSLEQPRSSTPLKSLQDMPMSLDQSLSNVERAIDKESATCFDVAQKDDSEEPGSQESKQRQEQIFSTEDYIEPNKEADESSPSADPEMNLEPQRPSTPLLERHQGAPMVEDSSSIRMERPGDKEFTTCFEVARFEVAREDDDSKTSFNIDNSEPGSTESPSNKEEVFSTPIGYTEPSKGADDSSSSEDPEMNLEPPRSPTPTLERRDVQMLLEPSSIKREIPDDQESATCSDSQEQYVDSKTSKLDHTYASTESVSPEEHLKLEPGEPMDVEEPCPRETDPASFEDSKMNLEQPRSSTPTLERRDMPMQVDPSPIKMDQESASCSGVAQEQHVDSKTSSKLDHSYPEPESPRPSRENWEAESLLLEVSDDIEEMDPERDRKAARVDLEMYADRGVSVDQNVEMVVLVEPLIVETVSIDHGPDVSSSDDSGLN